MKDLIWKKAGKGESADPAIMAFLAGEGTLKSSALGEMAQVGDFWLWL